jgi:cardiolipin synthase
MTHSSSQPLENPTPTLTLDSQHLHRTLSRVGDAPLRTGNEISILLNGEETYRDWFAAIEAAKKWVHLENYIFNNDAIGQKFAELLIKKAKEGVKVRVLYDWFGSYSTKRSFWNTLRQAGCEVRTVSPFRLITPLKILQRDHRKFLGVDGIYASTGGVCIGDDWLEVSPITKLPYRDTAVSLKGPAIVDLEEAFAKMWNSLGENIPIEENPSEVSFPDIVGDKAVRVIKQEPGKMRIRKVFEFMISGAEKRLWIADAYFIAIPSLYQSLIDAAKDGVDVRIILPSTNDIAWIGAVSRAGYRQLLEAGVRIWEYNGPMMHSKTTIIDGWWSRVGSTNLNISSLLLNWELDLIIEDREFGAKMEEIFEDDLQNAREICLYPQEVRKIRADRPLKDEELVVRHDWRGRGSGPRLFSTATRVGTFALKSGRKALQTHERKISLCVSAFTFAIALILIFIPRIVSWTLAFIVLCIGVTGVVRALTPGKREE